MCQNNEKYRLAAGAKHIELNSLLNSFKQVRKKLSQITMSQQSKKEKINIQKNHNR